MEAKEWGVACSRREIPRTKQIESRMLDLPEPLRPVIALNIGSKPSTTVRFAYDCRGKAKQSFTTPKARLVAAQVPHAHARQTVDPQRGARSNQGPHIQRCRPRRTPPVLNGETHLEAIDDDLLDVHGGGLPGSTDTGRVPGTLKWARLLDRPSAVRGQDRGDFKSKFRRSQRSLANCQLLNFGHLNFQIYPEVGAAEGRGTVDASPKEQHYPQHAALGTGFRGTTQTPYSAPICARRGASTVRQRARAGWARRGSKQRLHRFGTAGARK